MVEENIKIQRNKEQSYNRKVNSILRKISAQIEFEEHKDDQKQSKMTKAHRHVF